MAFLNWIHSLTGWKYVTLALVLLSPIFLGIYDIAAYGLAGNDATISRTFLRADSRCLAVGMFCCYGFGMFCGHLFLPQRPQE